MPKKELTETIPIDIFQNQNILKKGSAMKEFIKVMKTVSDPTRVKILKMLQQRRMCVCEIQFALCIAQSTTSKHLKLLEDAGLITYQKDGLWVNYELTDGSQSPFAASGKS